MTFSPHERAHLLRTPGIGPAVVLRLEESGIDSLARLRSLGVDAAVQLVSTRLAVTGWANRRGPLMKALQQTPTAQT